MHVLAHVEVRAMRDGVANAACAKLIRGEAPSFRPTGLRVRYEEGRSFGHGRSGSVIPA